jgi:hypothetical protein
MTYDLFDRIPAIRDHYRAKGWAPLKKLLPIEVADAQLYMMQKELGGDFESYRGDYIKTFLTDKKAFECYSFDYSPMQSLQWGLTPFISTVVGKDLLPSHCYFRVYRQGDICHAHSDAHDCEHAMSLTLGYSNDMLWAFHISDKFYDAEKEAPAKSLREGEPIKFHAVELSVGEAVLYNGINYIHGRLHPNPNRWAAQIFFHWVDRHGKYGKHAFDGRAAEVVRRANFVFPGEEAPEKINPNRAAPAPSRRR